MFLHGFIQVFIVLCLNQTCAGDLFHVARARLAFCLGVTCISDWLQTAVAQVRWAAMSERATPFFTTIGVFITWWRALIKIRTAVLEATPRQAFKVIIAYVIYSFLSLLACSTLYALILTAAKRASSAVVIFFAGIPNICLFSRAIFDHREKSAVLRRHTIYYLTHNSGYRWRFRG